ncbi:MAG: regulator [Planctomycetes bacterium TMED75]|nr:regulator [Planctomycetaceae bacterium]OUU90998.1 MAG: regulator [Planctomycetes bacterium TMED75]
MRRDQLNELSSKEVFTTGEAALLCGVSQQTIIRCFDSGKLNGFRVPGSRFRRIPRLELIAFMNANGIPVDALADSKRRILVVDDDESILRLVTEILSVDERIEVTTASNGYDAGILTERIRPDLLLLDYMLPDINGNVVCRRLKENPETSDIQIVIVSGAVDRMEINSLLAQGASAFIQKPFDPADLLQRVDHFLAA